MNLSEIAKSLEKAKLNAVSLVQVTKSFGNISVEEAYQIQAMIVESALSRGESISGYKMGLTSRAKQQDVGVFESISGVLLKSYEITAGQPLETQTKIHPRVEPEIAVVLDRNFDKPTTLREVREALRFVGPAFEIVDSRYENFIFTLPDVIADNTSASGYQVGRCNYLDRLSDLRLLGITVKKNGEIIETGAPASVLGDPLLSVVDLISGMVKRGRTVEAGKIILTGGITASVPLKAKDRVEILFPGESFHLSVV